MWVCLELCVCVCVSIHVCTCVHVFVCADGHTIQKCPRMCMYHMSYSYVLGQNSVCNGARGSFVAFALNLLGNLFESVANVLAPFPYTFLTVSRVWQYMLHSSKIKEFWSWTVIMITSNDFIAVALFHVRHTQLYWVMQIVKYVCIMSIWHKNKM